MRMDEHIADLPSGLSTPEFRLLYNGCEYRASVLSEKIIVKLRESLQDRYKYASGWELLFSTFEHGRSYKMLLESFERRLWPFLLVCKTDQGDIFGAFFEDRIKISVAPYGRPSTFLFTTTKHVREDNNTTGEVVANSNELMVFPASRGNNINIYCRPEFVAFGCSGGMFGLLINRTLLDGETHPVETFNNDPLASSERFSIEHLEVWQISI